MSKAAESVLAELHAKLAKSMVDTIEQSSTATALLLKYELDDENPLPNDVVNFLRELTEVSPSFMQAAAKFLKDNNITCDPGDSAELNELTRMLEEKRSRNKGNVTSIPIE